LKHHIAKLPLSVGFMHATWTFMHLLTTPEPHTLEWKFQGNSISEMWLKHAMV